MLEIINKICEFKTTESGKQEIHSEIFYNGKCCNQYIFAKNSSEIAKYF